MKKEKLLNAIGEIDDDLILDAVNDTKKRKSRLKWGLMAALLVLCVGAGFFGAGIKYASIKNVYTPNIDNTDESALAFGNTDNFTSDFSNTGNFVSDFGNMGAPTPGSGDEDNPAAADSTVILDANPSIALTVNAEDKIVTAKALNEDGEIVLSEMDLTDVDITVAVNAIIGSMLQKGYLSNLQNAILVSVENEDAGKSAALQERISSAIGSALQAGNLDGTVLSQTLNDTAVLEQMALEHHISLGKAALIQEVTAQDATLTAEKLAPLSITEIALISQSKNISFDALTQNGTPSDKAYISQEAAMGIAYAHAGVNAENVTAAKAEFDSNDGIMVYEVEFRAETAEYECDIDARTGQVVKYEQENRKPLNQKENAVQPSSGAQQPYGQYIGEEAAKKAALENAGIAADAVEYINAWLDYDDGRPEHYDVEFTVGSVEYQYKIDLYSGAVLKQETENRNGHNTDASGHDGAHNAPLNPAADIGAESARDIALSHAGFTVSQVSKLETEYDFDHGAAVYEVEFKCNGYEYEYKIDAATGAILEYEIDD